MTTAYTSHHNHLRILDKTKLPKISFTRIANNVKFVFNGAFPVIGVIGTIEVNDDSTEVSSDWLRDMPMKIKHF